MANENINQRYNLDATSAIRAMGALTEVSLKYVKAQLQYLNNDVKIIQQHKSKVDATNKYNNQLREQSKLLKELNAETANVVTGTVKLNNFFNTLGQFNKVDSLSVKKMANDFAILANQMGMTGDQAIAFYKKVNSGDFSHVTRQTQALANAAVQTDKALAKMDGNSLKKMAQTGEQAAVSFTKLVRAQTDVASGSGKLDNELKQLVKQMSKVAKESGYTAKQNVTLVKSLINGSESTNSLARANGKLVSSYIPLIQRIGELKRAKTEELRLQQKSIELSRAASRGLMLGAPNIASNKAFTVELQKTNAQLVKIGQQAGLNSVQLRNMVTRAALNGVNTYNGSLKVTYDRINAVIIGLKQLTRAKREWAYNAVRHIDAVNISWRSYMRYFITRIAYRSFMEFTSAVRAAIEAASELTIRISEVQTISQDSNKTVKIWADEFLRLSNAFPESTLEIAEAAYQALSNQVVNATETTGFLREALRLSNTTMTTASNAVNALSSVIKSYNLDASQAGDVSAKFFKIVELGRIRLEDIANTFGNVTILGAQLGVSFEEIGAAMTTISRQGVRPDQTMTLLRNVMLKLIKPTEEMKNLMASLGFETAQQAIQAIGFEGVLASIEEATRGSVTELGELFNRIRATVGSAGLISGQNLDQFRADLREISNDAATAYAEGTRIAFDTPARRLQLEMQRIKNFFTQELGLTFIDFADQANTAVGGATNLIKQMIEEARKLQLHIQWIIRDVTFWPSLFIKTLNSIIPIKVSAAELLIILGQTLVTLKLISKLGPSLSLLGVSFKELSKGGFAANRVLVNLRNQMVALKTAGSNLVALLGGWPGIITAIVGATTLWIAKQRQINHLLQQEQYGKYLDSFRAYVRDLRLANEEAKKLAQTESYFRRVDNAVRSATSSVNQMRKELLASISENNADLKEYTKTWEKLFNDLDDNSEVIRQIESDITSLGDSLTALEDAKFALDFDPIFGGDVSSEDLQKAAEAFKARAEDLFDQGEFDRAESAYTQYLDNIRQIGERVREQYDEVDSIYSRPTAGLSRSNPFEKELVALEKQYREGLQGQEDILTRIRQEKEKQLALEKARKEELISQNSLIGQQAQAALDFQVARFDGNIFSGDELTAHTAQQAQLFKSQSDQLKEQIALLYRRGDIEAATALQTALAAKQNQVDLELSKQEVNALGDAHKAVGEQAKQAQIETQKALSQANEGTQGTLNRLVAIAQQYQNIPFERLPQEIQDTVPELEHWEDIVGRVMRHFQEQKVAEDFSKDLQDAAGYWQNILDNGQDFKITGSDVPKLESLIKTLQSFGESELNFLAEQLQTQLNIYKQAQATSQEFVGLQDSIVNAIGQANDGGPIPILIDNLRLLNEDLKLAPEQMKTSLEALSAIKAADSINKEFIDPITQAAIAAERMEAALIRAANQSINIPAPTPANNGGSGTVPPPQVQPTNGSGSDSSSPTVVNNNYQLEVNGTNTPTGQDTQGNIVDFAAELATGVLRRSVGVPF